MSTVDHCPPGAAVLHGALALVDQDGTLRGWDRAIAATLVGTPAVAWTPPMVLSAARLLHAHPGEAAAAGVDLNRIPAPMTTAGAGPVPASPRAGTVRPTPGLGGWARATTSAAVTSAARPATPTSGGAGDAFFARSTPVPDLGGWAHAAAPKPRTGPAPASTEPFDYEHTIDGLRGIPVGDLSTVYDRALAGFTELGITSVYDLLTHIPLRYLDRSARTPIAELRVGETGTTIGTVRSSETSTTRTGMRLARVVVGDTTGELECTFFNAPWQAARFHPGDEVVIQGRIDTWTNPNTGRTTMKVGSPLIDRTGDNDSPVVPVYPQSGTTKGSAKATLTTWQIHRAAMEAVARMGDLHDPIPPHLWGTHNLPPRADAYRDVHRPVRAGDEHTARRRLAYDELLRMQLALGMRRATIAADPAITHTPTGALTGPLLASFPYALTGAQQRAITAITADMTKPHPMHRLLQGDVGAGKTMVGLHALLSAVESGHQGALMAPTEILATQLYTELVTLTTGLTTTTGAPITIRPLTNKVRTKARRETLTGLADGTVHIAVGTHALLSDDVTFASLGMVVVDEQHRFGVAQRAQLRSKGPGNITPDTLVMTATPIPRTAAMTVFGDLDVTVLDELPPGRTPIATTWVDQAPDPTNTNDPTWALIRDQVGAGRQAYVVCPLVEESETKAAAAATVTAEALGTGALAGLRVGVVHGKQKPAERDPLMGAFRAGDLDVLVATTVVEVGVSVPNATVMVIMEPTSFGIAQLHQLRGRVGRGTHPSRCVLAGPTSGADGQRRMDALCETTDGFKLSEVDLELRGTGSILGSAQHGLSDLRVASLDTDRDLLLAARDDASTLLTGDSKLGKRPQLRAEVIAALGPDGTEWLTRS